MAVDPNTSDWRPAADASPGPGDEVLLRLDLLDGVQVGVGWRTAHRDEWVVRAPGESPSAPGRTVHLHYSRVMWRPVAAGAT